MSSKSNIYCKPLVIDKLALIIDITKAELEATKLNLRNAAMGEKWHTIAQSGYYTCIQIPLVTTTIVFETRYRAKKGRGQIRLEFNPAKFTSDDWDALRVVGDTFISQGWEYLIQYGRATRLDIASDIMNCELETLCFTVTGLRKSEQYLGCTGKFETLYHGDKKAQRRVVGYDKGLEQGITAYHCTRIEAQLKKQSIPIAELPTLPCPFKGVTVATISGIEELSSKFWWGWFMSSVREKGLHASMMAMDNQMRNYWRGKLAEQVLECWQPKTMWDKEWAALLEPLQTPYE